MSFRKEKKFRVTRYDFDLLKNDLLLRGMKPLFAKRVVNSLYYDSKIYQMFNDSEEGLLPRKKVRIRWYDDIRKARKEVKISSAEGRYKKSYLINIPSDLALPQRLFEQGYGVIHPSLLVFYTREYFSFKSMRLTFDSSIKYTNFRQSQKITYEDSECVMEVKVSTDVPDDYIERMLSIPTSRFSKYSRGLLISKYKTLI